MPDLTWNVFTDRERVIRALRTGEGLPGLVRRLSVGSLACAILYGAVLGLQIGGWQVVSSPIKLPLIMLGTAALCIAVLYVMLALAGARLRGWQVVGLALCSVAASSTAMAALLPVAAFWTYVVSGNYLAVTLIHSAAFLACGAMGSRFCLAVASEVLDSRKLTRVMLVWLVIYGLVAQQMAWLFRPHFRPTEVFMRPLATGGSALEAIGWVVWEWLR